MPIRYYFSGFDREAGFPKALAAHLRQDIKGRNKLTFIPSGFSFEEKNEAYSKGFTETFLKAGFQFGNVVLLRKSMAPKEMQAHIDTSDAVYLLGGNPNTQLDILCQNALACSLRKTSAVVMGMSAGAMCMSRYSLLLPVSEEYPAMDIRAGMNLSGLSIYPHYNSNGEVLEVYDDGDEQTKKSDLVYVSHKYGDFYLLPDNSEIREQNGKITFIGKIIIHAENGVFRLIKSK